MVPEHNPSLPICRPHSRIIRPGDNRLPVKSHRHQGHPALVLLRLLPHTLPGLPTSNAHFSILGKVEDQCPDHLTAAVVA